MTYIWPKVGNVKMRRVSADYRFGMYLRQDGICLMCQDSLTDEELGMGIPVVDHCHETGRIRGMIHETCNIRLARVENFMAGRWNQYAGLSMQGLIEARRSWAADALRYLGICP